MKGKKIIWAAIALAVLAVLSVYLTKKYTYTTDYVLVTLRDGKADFNQLTDKFDSNEAAIRLMKAKADSQDDMWMQNIKEETAKLKKGNPASKYMIEQYVSRLNRQEVLLCVRHNKLFDADDLVDIIDRHGILSEEMMKELDRLDISYRTETIHDMKAPSSHVGF